MSFNIGELDYDSGGGFGPYEAEVIKAGITKGDRGAQLVFVCKPTNAKRRTQTLFYSMGKGVYTFGGASEVITTGEGEKAFENTIWKEIISGPKINIMTNAGLFLNALKHLGFELLGGDMSVYIGLKLDLEEVKSNEVISQFNEAHPKSQLGERTGDYAKGKITIPTRIIAMPAKKVPLKDQVLDFISAEKTELEVITWCKEEGASMKDVFANLDSEIEGGRVVFDGKTYITKQKDE